MFVPEKVFNRLMGVYDSMTENGLKTILAAKDNEVTRIVAVKDDQIAFLQDAIADLERQVGHERSRAEAAIDRLLEKENNVAAIRHADLEREELQKQVKAAPVLSPERKQTLEQIYAAVNSVGEDEGREDPMERTTSVGGFPVVQ